MVVKLKKNSFQIVRPLISPLCSLRCFFLDKIVEKLAGHAPADSMEVDGSEDPAVDVRALVNDCKFTMNLEMANSAWKQVKKMSHFCEETDKGKKKTLIGFCYG